MPEHVVPGVFVEEIPSGRKPIEGVATSSAAFVGVTAEGPLAEPTLVTSLAEYSQTFGAVSADHPVSTAVRGFFENGGGRAFITRTASGNSGAGTRDLVDAFSSEGPLAKFAEAERIGLLLTPDTARMPPRDAEPVMQAALRFSEARRIVSIFDIPDLGSPRDALEAVIKWSSDGNALRHPNAAVYFPRVSTHASGDASAAFESPGGTVAGLYARFDATRGVWKAPAGVEALLRGVRALELSLSNADMERLQAASINPLRVLPGGQVVAWGARTFAPVSTAGDWRYVSVRRLALFIEESLARGLQWAVFEPNDEALWAQIRLAASSFLYQLFRAGAFPGRTPREAYFVRCGRDTMTQDDIDNGRLTAIVGFAPLKPAEFVIIRIGQKTAEPN